MSPKAKACARALGVRQYQLLGIALAAVRAGAPIEALTTRIEPSEIYTWYFRSPVVDMLTALQMMARRSEEETKRMEAARLAGVVVDLATFRAKRAVRT